MLSDKKRKNTSLQAGSPQGAQSTLKSTIGSQTLSPFVSVDSTETPNTLQTA